jgi:hypothetical protein
LHRAGKKFLIVVAHRRSSTEIYLEDAKCTGIPVIEEINPDENTTAFVLVASGEIFVEQTAALVLKVIHAGDTGRYGLSKILCNLFDRFSIHIPLLVGESILILNRSPVPILF